MSVEWINWPKSCYSTVAYYAKILMGRHKDIVSFLSQIGGEILILSTRIYSHEATIREIGAQGQIKYWPRRNQWFSGARGG